MKRSISLALWTISSLTASAMADIMNFRTFPSCAYVNGQIYCFGGYVDQSLDETMYALDVSQFEGGSTSLMYSRWNKVTYNSPFDIEKDRIQPAVITVGDGKQLLVQGGHNTMQSSLVNHTILYDTTTKTWQSLAPYSGSDKIVRQIYLGTAVNMGDNNIGFYGGIEDHGNAMVNRTIGGTTLPLFNSTRVNIGYIPLQIFNMQTKVWSEFSPQNNAPYTRFPNSQSASINPATGKIYYLGGSYYTPASMYSNVRYPFNQALVFDSKAGSWSTPNFVGDVPTDRIYQTTTMIPNSDVLFLYGGSDDGGQKAATNYCYSLNLTTGVWKNEVNNVGVPDGKNGPRFAHSAVLVDSTLFILFGKGLSGSFAENAILTIDVSNPSSIRYSEIYKANVNINNGTGNTYTNNSTDGSNEEGLSKGAIGGIAAGSVVGGLAIIALIAFCIWRKKRDESRNNQPVDSEEVEAMQFDWDRIEDHFIEVPSHNHVPGVTAALPVASSYQHQSNSNIHSMDDDTTTTTTNSPLITVGTVVGSSNVSIKEKDQYVLTSAGSSPKTVKPSSPLTDNSNSRVDIIATKPDAV